MGGRVATRGGQCRHSDLGFCAQSRPAQLTGYRCDQYFDALAFASDALVHVTFEAKRHESACDPGHIAAEGVQGCGISAFKPGAYVSDDLRMPVSR